MAEHGTRKWQNQLSTCAAKASLTIWLFGAKIPFAGYLMRFADGKLLIGFIAYNIV